MDDLSPVIWLSEDADGESHFGDYDLAKPMIKFAPPALPFFVSARQAASGFVAVTIPVGWAGERHKSPHKQILFCQSGVLKVTASDGDVRDVGPGAIWLMTDTTGKGHFSEVTSAEPFKAVIILVD